MYRLLTFIGRECYDLCRCSAMWRAVDPTRVNQVSEVRGHSRTDKGSKLNVLCWLTRFHLLHHMDTCFWPEEGRMLVHVEWRSKMISRLGGVSFRPPVTYICMYIK